MAETMSSNSCRICMSSKMHHSSIFSNDLSRKITEIADVEVQEGDGLPPTICEDCEVDLDKCYKFRVQIQWADSKFRENLSVSEVVFEECQIKQEIAPMHPFMNEDNQDNEDDDDDRGPSDNDDDDYDMREEPEDKTENADKEGNQVTHPLDHVEIIENRTKQEIHMPLTDQNSQEEPLIVAQNMKSENEPTTDPLMHNEPQSMETDNILPGPSTSAPMVFGTGNLIWLPASTTNESVNTPGSRLPNSNEPINQKLPDSKLELSNQIVFPSQSLRGSAVKHCPIAPFQMALPGQQSQVPTKNLGLGSLLLIPVSNQSTQPLTMNYRQQLPVQQAPTSQVANDILKYRLLAPCPQRRPDRYALPPNTPYVTRINNTDNRSVIPKKHLEIERLLVQANRSRVKVSNLEYFTPKIQDVRSLSQMDYSKTANIVPSQNPIKDQSLNNTSNIHFEEVYIKEEPSLVDDIGPNPNIKIEIPDGDCNITRYPDPFMASSSKSMNEPYIPLPIKVETPVNITNPTKKLATNTVYSIRNQKISQLGLKHNYAGALFGSRNKAFSCNICNKIFFHKMDVKVHLTTHDVTETLCYLCGQTIIGGKTGISKHMLYKHADKFLRCKFCPSQFPTLKKLVIHRRDVHQRKRVKFCWKCGKRFQKRSVLRLHFTSHKS